MAAAVGGTPVHAPRPIRILAKRRESPRHVTFLFEDPALAGYLPGQFVMVWVPGVDEVPMAIWDEGGRHAITVEAKGDATTALCALAEGDVFGVRGPYGRPFQVHGKDLLVVVGGTGTVPLVPLVRQACAERRRVRVVLGGRTHEFLLLADAFAEAGAEVKTATDDGSRGFHGRAPDLAARLVSERRPDEILACGPERMMHAVAETAWGQGIPFQASLERWMKCAVGICDACLVDGLRLCRDGPVLTGEALRVIEDFGRFERLPDGRRVPLH
jgi:dihydroorotate dehydrogenase electron transfer subunit